MLIAHGMREQEAKIEGKKDGEREGVRDRGDRERVGRRREMYPCMFTVHIDY